MFKTSGKDVCLEINLGVIYVKENDKKMQKIMISLTETKNE